MSKRIQLDNYFDYVLDSKTKSECVKTRRKQQSSGLVIPAMRTKVFGPIRKSSCVSKNEVNISHSHGDESQA